MVSKYNKTMYTFVLFVVISLGCSVLLASMINCPIPTIRRLFNVNHYRDFNIREYRINFDPDEKTFRIIWGNSYSTNNTVLEIATAYDEKNDRKWTGNFTETMVNVSYSQCSLVITRRTKNNQTCHNVSSAPKEGETGSITHCIAFGSDFWYGGAEVKEQTWPINVMNTLDSQVNNNQKSEGDIVFHPFVSGDIGMLFTSPGSVLERYWVSSRGVGVFVDREVPLFVGQNSSHLCLRSAPIPHFKTKPKLKYTVCIGDNIKDVHQFMAKHYWSPPTGIPDYLMMRDPIWTTWAMYKKLINQSTVLEYAKEIKKRNFPISQLEIDDMFSTHYGDFDFDKEKFPDPKGMILTLHNMGCRVTAWIHPFMNIDSVNFHLAKKYGYLVWKDENRKEPLIMKWWNGFGGLLDFTNKAATNWYFMRRKALDELGMDSYKYDGGESNFLTDHFATNRTINDPNEYSAFYATSASSFTNRFIEVRVGYVTQHLPTFVRVMDMNSVWKGDRGLDVLIPTVLHFGLIGYPFVLPDMIGGNGYKGENPGKELFVRWVQVTAFLPSMQFSIAPWMYDEEVVKICHEMVAIHVKYVTPLLYKWSKVAVETGDPIIRPLWWIAPNDKKTYTEFTSFLIGNDVLVAPVIEEGVVKRDIYLPKGTWKDVLRDKIIEGPVTLQDYSIPLTDIAYFEFVESSIFS